MTLTADSVWNECLLFIKDNIKPQAYKTWFEPIKPVKISGEALTIQVPSKFFYEWLEEHYIKLLRVALVKQLGTDAKLIYDVKMENNYSSNRPQIVKIPSSNRDPLKSQKVTIPLESNKRELRNPFVIPGLQKVKIESQLNPNYNFDNFVEGDSNRLARSAGMAVANKPGGTSFNHAVMIAASDKITGPYDSNPRNPILTSRHLSKDNWVHSTGHADLVNVPDGRWFMVALGKRGDEQRESNMGRETHLIPISWEKATVRWQQVSDNEWAPVTYDFPVGAPETGKVERINPMPFTHTRQYQKDAFNDNFDESNLNLEWNFRRVPQANTFSLAARSGHLRLYAKPEVIENRVQASLMGFRQRESDFEYTASIYYQPKKEGEEAGMSLFQKDNNYINFTLIKEQGLMVLKVILKDPKEQLKILKQKILPNYEGGIMLRVISKKHQYQYQYSLDQGREYITFMSSKGDLILSHRTGSYTGAYLGLYATGNGKGTKAFMDVDWVFYQGFPRS